MPNVPVDVKMELERDASMVQQGSVPPQLFGVNAPQVASGYLGKLLENQATMRLGRSVVSYKRAAEEAMTRLFRKMQRLNMTVTLQGQNLRKRGMTGYFIEEFKSKDVPVLFSIRAEHQLETAIDKSAIANTAAAKVAAGISSRRRAMEETDVEDTYQESMDILEEGALQLSLQNAAVAALQLERQAKFFQDQGDTLMATALKEQARTIREQAIAQALQAEAGRTAPQPNAGGTQPNPQEVPVPVAQGGTQAPPEPTSGLPQARFGNENAGG